MLPPLLFPWPRSAPPTFFILESPLRKSGKITVFVRLPIHSWCQWRSWLPVVILQSGIVSAWL